MVGLPCQTVVLHNMHGMTGALASLLVPCLVVQGYCRNIPRLHVISFRGCARALIRYGHTDMYCAQTTRGFHLLYGASVSEEELCKGAQSHKVYTGKGFALYGNNLLAHEVRSWTKWIKERCSIVSVCLKCITQNIYRQRICVVQALGVIFQRRL